MNAALECSIAVTTRPKSSAPRSGSGGTTPPRGEQSTNWNSARNPGISFSTATLSLMIFMPIINSPKPTSALPMPLITRFPEKPSSTPSATAGSTAPEMSNEMICAVTVVPMFAPKMIPSD